MHKTSLHKLLVQYLSRYPLDPHAQKTLDFLQAQKRYWQRDNIVGHITASAWIVDERAEHILLTHHLKLNKWFQLGGHIEKKDTTIFEAATREAVEESGMTDFRIPFSQIFDIDVHAIPTTPAHWHYDVRILLIANTQQLINYDTAESKSVKWIKIEDIPQYNAEESMARMVEKTRLVLK